MAVAQTFYPIENARSVLASYREYAAQAPDEVTTLVALLRPPRLMMLPQVAGVPVVIVTGVYAGPTEEGETAMTPLQELGESLMDTSGLRPLTTLHDPPRFPDGRRYSWHSLYASELSDDVIQTIADGLTEAPSEMDELIIWQLGGAVADVPADATTFGFRDAAFLLSIDTAWDDPASDEEVVTWARRLWESLREQVGVLDGFYPGFPGFVEGEERARMAYGENPIGWSQSRQSTIRKTSSDRT